MAIIARRADLVHIGTGKILKNAAITPTGSIYLPENVTKKGETHTARYPLASIQNPHLNGYAAIDKSRELLADELRRDIAALYSQARAIEADLLALYSQARAIEADLLALYATEAKP